MCVCDCDMCFEVALSRKAQKDKVHSVYLLFKLTISCWYTASYLLYNKTNKHFSFYCKFK